MEPGAAISALSAPIDESPFHRLCRFFDYFGFSNSPSSVYVALAVAAAPRSGAYVTSISIPLSRSLSTAFCSIAE